MSARGPRPGVAIAAVVVAAFCLLPLALFLLTSFKTPSEVTRIPPTWVPSGGLAAYRTALATAMGSVATAATTTIPTTSCVGPIEIPKA